MGEQRAKSKDERLGNLRSLKNLGKTQRTLSVIIGFFGFRGYPRRGYDGK
jgi:hypothetical protein